MKLVALAALIAVCGAAKLDRSYLPPASAATAGGNSDSLQTPLTRSSEQGDTGSLPSGSYTNNFQGVVVDAAGAGTRASPDADQSGLGGPRDTYGSQNSKVGDAAFRGSIAGFRNTQFGSGSNGLNAVNVEQNLGFETKSERPQAFKDRNSNVISYANDVSVDNYSYGFESDNGIAIGENGVANNGIQAQGGYSYKGDDGQIYKVTYVADEGGYRPQGDHLPTPPPIPKEILESLEQNAKDEAAGLIDDGSYDAQKYNAEGDYTHHNDGNIQYNAAQLSQFAKRPESDATASNTFIHQNSQAFGKPGQLGNTGPQNSQSNFNDQTNQFGSNFGNNQNGQTGSQLQPSSQTVSEHQFSSSTDQQSYGISGSGFNSQFTQFGTQGAYGVQNSQFGSQNKSETSFPQSVEPTSLSTQQMEKLQLQGVSSSQFASQQYSGSTASISGQANKIPSFGGPSNTPSSINSVFNFQQSQLTNQQFKPQGTFGSTEYLPPFKSNNRPSNDKQINGVTSQDSNNSPNQGPQQSSSISSFASVGSSNVQYQSNQVLTGFPKQPSQNQYSFNNEQIGSNASPISTQHGESSSTGIVAAAKPTSIPSIELTTPLEPNENPTSVQIAQVNSDSSLNSQNLAFPSPGYQTQSQSSLQNSVSAAQQPISQSSSSLLADSRPQGTFQFSASSPAPATFSTTLRPNTHEENFQYSQNSASSIPSFAQGSDNSYYYNQPSKPFGTPVARPQAPRFPITPFNQPNVVSQQQSFNPISSPGSLSATPTSSSQFTQTQGSFSANQYNGITQASISPFPSVSPTSTSQYNASPADRYESKPGVPSFPSRPGIGLGQNPPTSFTQNQIQFGQSTSSNSNFPSISQSVSSKPIVASGPNSFTQTSTPLQQNKPQNEDTNQENGSTSTLTQQYDGMLYEYNKPPEVLPASEQSDSSSSQTIQTDSSSKPQESPKPQTGPQPVQFSQNTISLQSQQSNSNQEKNPQFSSQLQQVPFGGSQQAQNQFNQISQTTVSQQNVQDGTSQPITSQTFSGSQQAQNQFGQISQTTVSQHNAQVGTTQSITNQPNESVFSNPTQFGQNQQTSQYAVQPAKPVGQTSSSSQYGQHLQTIQTNQQPNKPFGGAQTSTQFGQNTQSNFGSLGQQNSKPQAFAQPNRPFGSVPKFGQAAQQQTSLNNQQLSSSSGSYQSGVSSGFQGYPSSKPQIGNQLALPQFTQQTFGTSQINSQIQADTVPSKPFNTASAIHGSSDSLKPHFGQNSQLSQGSVQPGSSFSQQSYQASQFGSKPQFTAQSQFGQNLNAANPFGSATSQAQVGQNSAQASSSAVSQPSSIQSYRPFGNSNFQSQNKPQFDQALQSSTVSTTSAPQTEAQSFGTQGSQNQPSLTVPCCKSINKDSAIAPLNVGKPSQAFAQTQSQFTGFQGSQSFNAQSLAGKGEEFGGPRQPPSFDAQTGYHY